MLAIMPVGSGLIADMLIDMLLIADWYGNNMMSEENRVSKANSATNPFLEVNVAHLSFLCEGNDAHFITTTLIRKIAGRFSLTTCSLPAQQTSTILRQALFILHSTDSCKPRVAALRSANIGKFVRLVFF